MESLKIEDNKMNGQKPYLGMIWAILATLLLIGCSAPADDMIEVTFDGNECTVSDTTELTVGEHPFVVKNLTEENVSLRIGRLLEDHSFQDFVDNIEEQGPGRNFEPDWISCCDARFVASEKGESEDEEIITLGIRNEGEHAIYIFETVEESFWPCAPLKVVEAPSQ